MPGLLVLLVSVSACSVAQPPIEPAAHHEVILDVTNWTITMNGSAMIRSDEHDFIPGGWTAGRIVVDRDEATGEWERPQPAPSN